MKKKFYLSHFFKTNSTIFVHINSRKLILEISKLLIINCASQCLQCNQLVKKRMDEEKKTTFLLT